MAELLQVAVRGSNFSTHLRRHWHPEGPLSLMRYPTIFPTRNALITIEDAAELQLQQLHVGRLETRPPNVPGASARNPANVISSRMRCAMRPDLASLSAQECRGEGSLRVHVGKGHEHGSRRLNDDGSRQFAARCAQASRADDCHGGHGAAGSERSWGQIASAITLVMQLQRLPDGRRRLTSVDEIRGMEGENHSDAGNFPLL